MIPVTDDEIREKYLERAIREINHFARDLTRCSDCPRGNASPILGSGHPQADIFLIKFAPQAAEREEGIAFYGRAGTALSKALKRLDIDPLAVYGTVCIKCAVANSEDASPRCLSRLAEEVAIVSPRVIVVMGESALEVINLLSLPGARELRPAIGEIQNLTAARQAIFTPDIDLALDDERSKREFWHAFRTLGDWYAEQPPY